MSPRRDKAGRYDKKGKIPRPLEKTHQQGQGEPEADPDEQHAGDDLWLGSNIFNYLFIIGIDSLFFAIPAADPRDTSVMIGFTLAIFPFLSGVIV